MAILHSKIIGEGPALIILHGFLGMSDNWKSMGRRYAEEGMQVHLVDQRNHGRSFWSSDFNYTVLVEDLLHYMKFHNLTKPLIMGHSMGGKTAMQLSCDYEDEVSGLVVADIAPRYYPPHHQEIINALNKLDLERYHSRNEANEALAHHIKEVGIRQFLLKNLYWKEPKQLDFRMNLEVLSSAYDEVGEGLEANAIYEGPSLFIKGDRSEYIGTSDLEDINRHFPKSELATVSGAGHWVHAENPEAFFNKTLPFILG
jgi:pimeloyl-ACP methyl ester carboxylesterase